MYVARLSNSMYSPKLMHTQRIETTDVKPAGMQQPMEQVYRTHSPGGAQLPCWNCVIRSSKRVTHIIQ